MDLGVPLMHTTHFTITDGVRRTTGTLLIMDIVGTAPGIHLGISTIMLRTTHTGMGTGMATDTHHITMLPAILLPKQRIMVPEMVSDQMYQVL